MNQRDTFQLPSSQESYWLGKSLEATYPSLSEDIECDVVIVGGGISGLSTAWVLKEAGLRIVVLEKNTIGSGTSGGTTGKVTTQHGLIYSELIDRWGKETAQHYADAAQAAFHKVKNLINTYHIQCNWQERSNYIYTTQESSIKRYKNEATAATSLGLPATYETKLDLPFTTVGAVKFADQATFHVHKYLQALASQVNGKDSHVFELSNATGIEEGEESCQVRTEYGSVTAKHIVVATKVPPGPLLARVSYAVSEYPETSYIVAGTYEGNLRDMYISSDENHYSLLPVDTSEGTLLLIGGQNHIPGLGLPSRRHAKLAQYGQQWFGMHDFRYRWKAMDYMAYDNLPLVGKVYPWSTNLFTIAGLRKWGLNLSMVAAMTIHDLILDVPNPTIDLFYPHRLSAPASIPKKLLSLFR